MSSDDCEDIKVNEAHRPSDLSPVVGGALKQVPFKLLTYVFIIYLLLSSEVFIDRILSKVNGAVEMSMPTTYGTVITGILLVIFTGAIDMLIDKKVL